MQLHSVLYVTSIIVLTRFLPEHLSVFAHHMFTSASYQLVYNLQFCILLTLSVYDSLLSWLFAEVFERTGTMV